MKNILFVSPNPDDATSAYRGAGPMGGLRRVIKNVNLFTTDKLTWSTFVDVDLVFLQRPHSIQHLQIMMMAKQQNIPIVIDYDDLWNNIPDYNAAKKHYSDPNNIEIMKRLMQNADVLLVSTEHLKTMWKSMTKAEIIVVPNAHNDYMFGDLKKPEKHGRKIVWRGGHTHREDLNIIAQEVIQLSHDHPDFNWHFVGDRPWFCSFMKEGTYSFQPPLDIMQYFDYVKQLNAAAWIFPLVDNDFNRAKSNISYMEAAMCGSMMFAQDLPEFDKPGCVKFKTAKEFSQKIKQLIAGKVDVQAHVKQAQDYIRDNLLLSSVNEIRVDVFKRLLGE